MREYLGKYDYYIQKKEAVQSGSKYLDELAKSNSLDERKNEDAFISGGEKNMENMTSGENIEEEDDDNIME